MTLSNVFNCIGQTCGPGLTESPECTGKRQSLKVSFFYTRLTDIVFVLSNMIYIGITIDTACRIYCIITNWLVYTPKLAVLYPARRRSKISSEYTNFLNLRLFDHIGAFNCDPM